MRKFCSKSTLDTLKVKKIHKALIGKKQVELSCSAEIPILIGNPFLTSCQAYSVHFQIPFFQAPCSCWPLHLSQPLTLVTSTIFAKSALVVVHVINSNIVLKFREFPCQSAIVWMCKAGYQPIIQRISGEHFTWECLSVNLPSLCVCARVCVRACIWEVSFTVA